MTKLERCPMGPQESDKRYEAVVYTIKGVHKADFFDDCSRARAWLMKRCEETHKAGSDYAAVIYDQHEKRKRVYVDDRCGLLAGKDYH